MSIVNPYYRNIVYNATAATGLAVWAVLSPWESVRIVGLTVLTGVGYGIANDMIACRDCIEYFTVGHVYDDKRLEQRLVSSLDPNLNAAVWGAVSTWELCTLAGVLLALVSRVGPLRKISTAQLTPWLGGIASVTLLAAHLHSRNQQEEMKQGRVKKYDYVPSKLQAGWEACNARNGAGYEVFFVSIVCAVIAIPLYRFALTNPL